MTQSLNPNPNLNSWSTGQLTDSHTLSIWLLFVVILLRKIAHPLRGFYTLHDLGRLYGDLLRYSSEKGLPGGHWTMSGH